MCVEIILKETTKKFHGGGGGGLGYRFSQQDNGIFSLRCRGKLKLFSRRPQKYFVEGGGGRVVKVVFNETKKKFR